MSKSSLVSLEIISPNKSERKSAIDTITIHHMACVNASLTAIGNMFAKPEREASSNYGIDSDGNIALYVEEEYRSWCSGNEDNDTRAITIEVANSSADPDWEISDAAYASLIKLCADICQRYDINELKFTGNTYGNLTMHCMFQATACPGPYLKKKIESGELAELVNAMIKPQEPIEEPVETVDDIVEDVEPVENIYTVVPGDTLWDIACRFYGDGTRYVELAEKNNIDNPNLIYPGDKIVY